MLLTRIPFFKEVIIMSFACPHCGYANNEIQSAGRIQDKGCTIKLAVSSLKDLNRQVVKSDVASFTIPELEFESPPFSHKGELNTIEGLLERAITGLGQEQPVRKIIDPENAAKIDNIVSQLTKCRNGEMKFTLILDDSSGNSFIENPLAPEEDPMMTVVHYTRKPEQDAKLGIAPAVEEEEKEEKEEEEENKETNVKDEVLSFPTNCSSCNAPAETRMKLVAGMEAKGTRITLRITDPLDLNRDVLKSETCEINIPSLDSSPLLVHWAGRFTTLEGLLSNVRDQLQSVNPFGLGDSPAMFNEHMKPFLSGLDKIIKGEDMGVVIILDDPAGKQLHSEIYTRPTQTLNWKSFITREQRTRRRARNFRHEDRRI
ncbi:nucleolar zinc-finger protein [Desmophyllum pertusum]|uniref:Nucleolar zinc-finger protein n=1 Tax=Desmophyllum pertusum TaxID=174260 RepID=A0A9X0D947_9CNID|nr:nucleolar zinc-finger protein [Desmophyllum pertusum]